MSPRLFNITRYLVLALLLLQGVAPVFGQAQSQLAIDDAFCGTQSELTTDVVIRSPLADEAPAPEPHENEHCSLCYIQAPSAVFDHTAYKPNIGFDKHAVEHFTAITNLALQDQHRQRLAFSHAPPHFS